MTFVTGSVRWACVLVAVGMLGLASAARAETIEGVEKAVAASWEKIKSASFETTTTSVNEGQGYSMKMTSTGKNELLHNGAEVKMRQEAKTSTDMVAGGNTTKTDSTTLLVVDGTFAYTLMDNAGQKMAMKTDGKIYTEGAGGAGLFKLLRDTYDLSALADENVDGKAVYVIQAKDKKGGDSTAKYYIAKDTGMTIQMVMTGAGGKSTTTAKYTNIKIDPAIPADHFTFTPPAGVQLMDQTKK